MVTNDLLVLPSWSERGANDLWIRAEDNQKRFEDWGVSKQITPVSEDANNLSFEKGKFDALFSVDSYHYFATGHEYAIGDKQFYETLIKPYTCFVGIYIKLR